MAARFGPRRRAPNQEEFLSFVGFVKEERAAIAEFNGGLSRDEVKRRQQEAAKALGVNVEESIDLGGGVKLVMVLIPAGEFLMGSSQSPTMLAQCRFTPTGSSFAEKPSDSPSHPAPLTGIIPVTEGLAERSH